MDTIVEFVRGMLVLDPGADLSHQTSLRLAAVFACAVVVARLAGMIKFMPKVTAYLLVGMMLGKSGGILLDYDPVLNGEARDSLKVLYEIGLLLILFLVGTEFRMEGLGTRLRKALKLSAWDVATTFVITFLLVLGAALVTGMELSFGLTLALILGVLACEIGPASTLAVAKESSSHGPYTDHLRLLVGNSNLMTLVAFGLVLGLVVTSDEVSIGRGLAGSLWWLAVPLPVGALMGIALAWGETFERKSSVRLLMMLAALMAVIGVSKTLGISEILTVMVVGFTYANASVKGMSAVETLRPLETPFYVIFFIYAGAKLDVSKLGDIGLLGVAYVVARMVGKFFGVYWGAKKIHLGENRPTLLGISSHAHSAIVLGMIALFSAKVQSITGASGDVGSLVLEGAGAAQERLISMANLVYTLILGSVVVFEVYGPVMVKVGVLRSGEVSIVDAVPHKSRVVDGNQFLGVVREFLSHIGLWRRRRHRRKLADLVIQDTHALAADADFIKVTRFIEHYPYDSFPVLGKDGNYIGYISFNEVKDTAYDPTVTELIRAADLLAVGKPIDLDEDDIHVAYARVRQLTNTSLPVVRKDEQGKFRLVGLVLQRDLTAAHVADLANQGASGAAAATDSAAAANNKV